MTSQAAENIKAFINAYMVCALWSSNDESTPEGGEPLDKNCNIKDIAKSAYAKMVKDCAAFLKANESDLTGLEASQCGHDFWLSRNGHGAGFFDRDLGEKGDRLQEAARKFGECNLYVGDDKKIHVM